MLRWEQTEFVLKGVYLGLLVLIGWLHPTWNELLSVALIALAGLVVCLGFGAFRKLREGYKVRGQLLGFTIFLVLENPGLIYAGLVGGLALGAWLTFRGREVAPSWEALAPVAGGAVLGLVLDALRHVRDRKLRGWLGLGLTALIIAGAAVAFLYRPDLLDPDQQLKLAILLLAGIPGFYVMTFASVVEESEVETAAMCAALGVGLGLLFRDSSPTSLIIFALALPLALYYGYTGRILPGLRVFKHALRGMSYRQIGNTKLALASLRRALELDPHNALARGQLWQIHRTLDAAQLKSQPEIIPLIDYHLCLERVAALLLQERPAAAHLREAEHLLELIPTQQPALEPCCAYWRAVTNTHERRFDAAVADLESILRLPQTATAARRSVHFQAWQLALLLHPELRRRVGDPLLRQPGERMDAIVAVETRLAEAAADASARDLQRVLYSELTEAEYATGAPDDKIVTNFNHDYVQQLGLALLEDKSRWQRGCEFLRIAARGLPAQAPGIYIRIAQAHEAHGDPQGMWANYQRAMQLGRAVGVAGLSAEEQSNLFPVVRKIGENAMAENQLDAALEAFKFYTQYDQAGKETYRTLAELFRRRAARDERADKEDVWLALNCVEHALTFDANDADLKRRKDELYYSVGPDDLKARLEKVRAWFDVHYCLEKARWLLDRHAGDVDLLDWAAHLADLAQTMLPGSIAARFLRARIRRLRGEGDEAIALLENIRQNRPEKFANGEEADAWHYAHRLLGDLYLDSKPDQAVLCYNEFRTSEHSGADTLYKLGRAYENLGDLGRAARCYEAVTTYETHPLYYEAREALDRVRRQPQGAEAPPP